MNQTIDTDRDTPSGAPDIGLLDMAIAMGENLRLLVLVPLATGLLALGFAFTIEPTFVARASFLPPQPQQSGAMATLQSLGAAAALAGAAGGGIKSQADQYMALLTSRTVLDRMIDRFKLMQVYDAEYREHARRTLDGNIKTTSGKDGLIKLELEDHDPQRAAQMANALMEELGTLLGRLALTEAQQRRAFFEKQLKDTRDALGRAQQALQQSGVDINSLKLQPQAAVSAVAELQAMIVSQEIALDSMRSFLTPSSPDYQRAAAELAALKRQLTKASIAEQPQPAGGADYVAKFREYKYQETLFELFSRQYEAAKLDESRDGSTIQIVDPAAPPELKSKPQKALIAIVTTLLTAFVLMLFVVARAAVRALSAHPDSAAKLAQLKSTLRFRR